MEGIIPVEEFKENDELSKLKIGSKVQIFLERIESARGQLIVSRDKARKMEGWKSILKLHKEDKIVNFIRTRIREGMIVEINGFSCFMPTSQLSLSPTKNIDQFLNTPLKFKILSVDASRGNAICSRRKVLSEDKDIETKEQIKEIKVGQKITATCSGITSWGGFFQYKNGLVLLAHISDLAWSRINILQKFYLLEMKERSL